jgi:hypothetical protein
MRIAYTILVGENEGKRQLIRRKRKLDYNIKMDLREIGSENVDGLIWLSIWSSCRLYLQCVIRKEIQKYCMCYEFCVNNDVVLSAVIFMIFKFSVVKSVGFLLSRICGMKFR